MNRLQVLGTKLLPARRLLRVGAVTAEPYERVYRSNLVGFNGGDFPPRSMSRPAGPPSAPSCCSCSRREAKPQWRAWRFL